MGVNSKFLSRTELNLYFETQISQESETESQSIWCFIHSPFSQEH